MLPRHATAGTAIGRSPNLVWSVLCPPRRSRLLAKGAQVRLVTRTVMGGFCLLTAGCSGAASTPTPRASTTPFASASAATTACASVQTTTAIDKVPAACQVLWEPYHVTMVPPADELQQEHVPPAPTVKNMTNGAVAQADAQHWADASNLGSGWFKWAEEYDQPFLLDRLVAGSLVSADEQTALSQGASILQPDCNLYPTSVALFPVGPDGDAYFTRKNLPADKPYVLVATAPVGSCSATVTYPDGRVTSLPEPLPSAPFFIPGQITHDPLLGDLWYTDAGGNCNDAYGPPAEWCGR